MLPASIKTAWLRSDRSEPDGLVNSAPGWRRPFGGLYCPTRLGAPSSTGSRSVMAEDIPIRCACGKLEGVARGLAANRGNHVVCYCDDCQSFAHYLGKAEQVLDEHGGTEIFQTSPARFEVTAGHDHLACMRLKPEGLVRWYASCCNTPIGNTLATRNVPFVGLICNCIDHTAVGRPLDQVLGPVKAGVNGRFATSKPTRPNVHDRIQLSQLVGFIGRALSWRLRGDHKRSPFFDSETGALSVTPTVVSEAERRNVESARDAASGRR